MISILTQYRTDQRGGPGFYNFLTYTQTKSSGEVIYGPYESRPVAKREASLLRERMKPVTVAA